MIGKMGGAWALVIAMAIGKREHESYHVLVKQPMIQCCKLRGSIVVSISACHAEDPGSIPGRGAFLQHGFSFTRPGYA